MPTDALIDADILAYQAASTAEQATDWGEGMWTLHADEKDAKRHFVGMINSILERTNCDEATLVWSSSTNWRKAIYEPYKSNRAATRKPMVLKTIREWAQQEYHSIIEDNLEGDDLLGLLATDPELDGKYIVCTIDKDMRSVPASHYNFGRDEFFEVSEFEADRYHMLQTLTGDATDGYTGCTGVGPKTAEKYLIAAIEEGTPWAKPEDMKELYWKHVVKAYEKAGLSEEFALSQARVARILRHGEYDFKTKEVKLWTPASSTLELQS